MADAINIRAIGKSYAGASVLKDVSLAIPSGARAVLLGPNGAGKSTLLEIIATLRRPDTGSIAIGGVEAEANLATVRRQIGLVPQANSLDPHMTPMELLTFQGIALGMKRGAARERAEELIATFALEAHRDKRTAVLSGGTRRKVDLALALVGEPGILILDEPTTGLDPTSRLSFWEELRRLNAERGTTLLVASQDLHEAETLATQVIVLKEGQVVANDSPQELKRRVGSRTLLVHARSQDAAARIANARAGLFATDAEGGTLLRLALPEGEDALPPALETLASVAADVANISLSEPSMDDVFAALARA